MAKVPFVQSNFTLGEISPRAMGRFDHAKFANGAKTLENWLIYQLGGAMFCPGTVFVAETKTSAKEARLLKFEFSTSQKYLIEMGDEYMRFYANQAQVVTAPSTPSEITTVYPEEDIWRVHYTQDADTVYLFHPDYPPQKLQRLTATTFRIQEVVFIRGPFLDANISKVTLQPSAATGNITVTAAAPAWGAGNAYINGPDLADFVTNGGNTYKCLEAHVSGSVFATDLAAGKWELVDAGNVPEVFDSGHVGSLWRVNDGVVKITAVTNSYTVTASVQAEPNGVAGNLGGTSAYTDWAEGVFSAYRGYPATGTFHEQRLYMGGSAYKPSGLYGSYIRQYDNFKADASDDSAAVKFQIYSNQVNGILWMDSGQTYLQIGTTGGTFSASSGTAGTTITATNIIVTKDTNYGCAPLQPKRISSYLYYMQSNLYQMRELFFNYLVDSQVSNDMNLFADHILRDGQGVVDFDRQQSPNDRLWCVRDDGQLSILTRNPEQEVMGWSRRIAGADAAGNGKFESIAIIQTDGGDDEIWVIVNRTINGTTKRYIEYMTSEYFDDQEDAIRLDSSLTLESVTPVTSISGLDHLEGETVSVVLDGCLPSEQQTYVVESGSITLKQAGYIVHVGLPYEGTIEILKIGDASIQGQLKRTYLSLIRVFRTLGLKIGQSSNYLCPIFYRKPSDPPGVVPDLVSKDIEKHFDAWWAKDAEIMIKQHVPLPAFILAVILKNDVEVS